MKYALKNIIDNAVESMPDNGVINLSAENVEPDFPLVKGKYVKLSIQDHGIGIPKEHLSQIYDPYFSTKERGTQKGMGLGLATTYSIINQHSGHITVDSEVGTGTTFTLYLPVYEKDVKGSKLSETSVAESPEFHTGRILLMDDEQMIRNLGKQLLSRLGYDAELAKDGDEAVELYKKALASGNPFEVVILDLAVKGGMGGKYALGEILKINPQAKAVVSSGYSDDPIMADFRSHGFTGALSKPYMKNDVENVLNKVILESR
jgi:CheY-like chemotaxis protein/anti-sigma regulatory factor (Ser/Thr protein kinase)